MLPGAPLTRQSMTETNPDLDALKKWSWVENRGSTVLTSVGSLCFCYDLDMCLDDKSCGSQAFPEHPLPLCTVAGLFCSCWEMVSVILVKQPRPANSIDGTPLVMVTC